MSNLATAEHLRRATSQLPVSWYCDPAVFEAEQRAALPRAARLRRARAHGARIRATTTRSPWRDNAQVLVRNADGRRALSRTSAATGRRSCSTAAATRRTSSARFTAGPTTSRASSSARRTSTTSRASISRRSPLTHWNGLLFDGTARRRARSRGARRAAISTSRATCSTGSRSRSATTTGRRSSRSISRTTTSARSIPGWASSSPATTCSWEFGDRVLAADRRHQRAARASPEPRPTSAGTRRCSTSIAARSRSTARSGSRYYPNVMLEWYPHVLVISTLIPRGVDRTTNVVEFYYPEEIALFEREFVEAEQAAYMETAAEDDEIARADGRRPARALQAGAQRERAPTSRRWKTACSTSTSSCGESSTGISPRR